MYAKLDADLAGAMMSINAVKAVEIGAGFASVAQRGSEHGDELTPEGFVTNHAVSRRYLHRPGGGGDHRHQAHLQYSSVPRRSIDKAGQPVW